MTSAEISAAENLNQEFKFYGICVNCDHRYDCIYRQNPDKPILFCEQFEVFTPPAKRISLKKRNTQTKTEDNEFVGLCKNCEKRFECKYPKPEGGIWHCEEYL